jgi:hypothetical protein
MATLYELTDDYLNLLDMAQDPDCDLEVFKDTLEGLDYEIEDKADGYAKVIRELTARAEGLKAEIERLTNRKKAIETNIDNMKRSLENAMIITGKTKFKTDLFSFGIQKNTPTVIIDEQYIENIPEEYLIEQDPKIDKAKIKEDIKAGKNLDGIAHLEQSESIRIR